MSIHKAMAQVMAHFASEGIAKLRDSQGYKFRGIDDVLNAFARPLADAGIVVIPSYEIKHMGELPTKSSSVRHTVVMGTFRLAVGGSELDNGVTIGPFVGEACDSLDKSASKAMSVALRNALLQTFIVPLGAEADPEHGRQAELGGGDDETVDEAQQAKIQEWIDATKSDTKKLLAFLNVERVKDVPKSQYANVISVLRRKDAQLKAKAGGK